MTNAEIFKLALRHLREGRLAEAEQACRQILATESHAEALHLLGVIAMQVGKTDTAVSLLRQAVQVRPAYAEALNNLSVLLRTAGQVDEAIDCCRKAIEAAPAFAAAHCNLGLALWDKGDIDQALASCQTAVALNPKDAKAFYNLALLLRASGRLADSISAYQNAIALKPDDALAYNNLSNVLRESDRIQEAIAAARRAVELDSSFAEAYNNLGVALHVGHQLDDAISALRQATTIKPDYGEAYSNLGHALKDAGRVDEAIAAQRRAVGLCPDNSNIHSNLIYCMNFDPDCDAHSIAQEQRQWNRRHAAPLAPEILPHVAERSSRRLRIGYVSPDFRDHVIGRNILPLMTHHDRARFELFAYSMVNTPDALTERLRGCFDGWRDIRGLSDRQAVQQIGVDQIDILMDLTLHLQGNRILIFAHKPAPIQVTFAGYPGSTGLTAIDFRLSDPFLDPPGCDESIYSEKTIRLPGSFWCYDPMENGAIAVNALPARSNRFLTFGCINNFCKTNLALFDLWASVLRGVPDSQLLVLAPEGSHRQRTVSFFEKRGVAPRRIAFEPPRPRGQYLELFHRVDIALDTLPYNGHTSSLDALWMGVPVITMPGRTVVGRAGVSQLMNLQMPELIAKTPEQYVQLAIELSRDWDRLAQLRSTLRTRMERSPLMDSAGFARGVEAAYLAM